MAEIEDPTGEFKFLHDLSNVMAIAQGHLQVLKVKLKKGPGEIKAEDMIAKLDASLTAMTKLAESMNVRKESLRAARDAATKQAS